jgi:transcription elongation GreA/GreB family factor
MSIDAMKQLVANTQWTQLESAWMDAMDTAPAGELEAILASLLEADQTDLAQTLAWMWLEARVEAGDPAAALPAARAAVSASPDNADLRAQAADLYKEVHGDHPHLDALLAASGLTGNQSPRRALRTLETCLAITEGAYLVNRFEGDALQVTGFNDVMGEFDLTDAKVMPVSFEPKQLADEYDIASETDFRVLSQLRRDELKTLLKKDIAAVLIGICQAEGGEIDATQLKALLTPKYVPADKWSGWWGRARTAVKKNERLTLEGKNPATILYHEGGLSLEQELAGAADSAREPLEYLAVLRQYAQQLTARGVSAEPSFTAPLMDALAKQAVQFAEKHPGDALVAALAVAEATNAGIPAPAAVCPTPAEILASAEHPADVIVAMGDTSLWPAALEALADHAEGTNHLARLMLLAPADQLDDLAARLKAAGQEDAVTDAVAQALAASDKYYELCIWLWQGPAEMPAGVPGRIELLARLLGALDDINRGWEVDNDLRKTASQRVRNALASSSFAGFKEAVELMNEGIAATMKRRIERCDGLAEGVREDLLDILREAYYGLFVKRKAPVAPWADPDTLWVTDSSLKDREARLKELVEVRMLENARAIGEAADHGDLSENSEWKYALEERDRLAAQAGEMRDGLSKARVIEARDVPTDSVGIGSRVTLQSDAGAEITLDFLGPWDVDVDGRVFSYQSQMAQDIMGKTIGDEVELRLQGAEGIYKIASLASAVE